MAFVKLDTGILDSSIWGDRLAREVFLTALCMARPHEILKEDPELDVITGEPTGWNVPPGWYGLVEASGTGIARRAVVANHEGLDALKRLAEPEAESRTPDYEGRRVVRVAGGFIVLNFDIYRGKDHTAADRSRRYRERKRHGVTSRPSRGNRGDTRSVTQAEAEAEAEADLPDQLSPKDGKSSSMQEPPVFPLSGAHPPKPPKRKCSLSANWAPTAEHHRRASRDGLDLMREAERFRLHAEANGRLAVNWNAAFTMWLTKAKPSRPEPARSSMERQLARIEQLRAEEAAQ